MSAPADRADPGDTRPSSSWSGEGSSFDRVVAALHVAGVMVAAREGLGERDVAAGCPCPDHAPHSTSDDGSAAVRVWWSEGVTHLECTVSTGAGDEQPHDPTVVLDALGLSAADLSDVPDGAPPPGVAEFPAGGRDGAGDGEDTPGPHGRLPRLGNTTWGYSTGADGWARGVYSFTRGGGWQREAALPHAHDRLEQRDDRGDRLSVSYQLSMRPDDGRGEARIVSQRDVDSGDWAQYLDVTLPPDQKLRTAVSAAIGVVSRSQTTVATESTPRWRDDGHLELPPAKALPAGYGVAAGGGEDRARQAWAGIAAIAARAPKLALTLGVALGGCYIEPLRRQCGRRTLKPFAVLMHGGQWEGKSNALQAAAAVVGDPGDGDDDDRHGGVVSGANWSPQLVPQRLAQLGCLPMFGDELEEAGFDQSAKQRLVLSTHSGGQRSKATRDDNPKTLRRWQSTMLLTANDPITDKLTDAGVGVASRLVEIQSPITATAQDSDDLTDHVWQGFGWPLRWIRENPDVDGFAAELDAAAVAVGSPTSVGPALRLARHLAVAVAGAARLEAFAGGNGGMRAAAVSAARELLAEAAGDLAELPVDDRLLEAVAEYRATRGQRFVTRETYRHSPGVELDGWDVSTDLDSEVPGDLAVTKAALDKIAAAAGIDNKRTALKMLRRREVLATNDNSPTRLQYRLPMPAPLDRGRWPRVYLFTLDPPEAGGVTGHRGTSSTEGADEGAAGGPGPRTPDNGAGPPAAGSHGTSTGSTPRGNHRGHHCAPSMTSGNDSVLDLGSHGSHDSHTALARSARVHVDTGKETPAMGLATLVAHLQTVVDGDPLATVRRRAVAAQPCTSCGLPSEMLIGGVLVHPTCLRELIADEPDASEQPGPDRPDANGTGAGAHGADLDEQPDGAAHDDAAPGVITDPGGLPPAEGGGLVADTAAHPAEGPEQAPVEGAADDGDGHGSHESLAPVTELPGPHQATSSTDTAGANEDQPLSPAPVDPPREASREQLPTPAAPGGGWRAAVAVLDTDAVYLPDGHAVPYPGEVADARHVLAMAERLAIGHPSVLGMLIVTEALCEQLGIAVELDPDTRDDQVQRRHVLSRLAEVGEGFLAPAVAAGWRGDRGVCPVLSPRLRLRRGDHGRDRVLEILFEPYVWVWDQSNSGLVNALPDAETALPPATDPAVRSAELARRAGRFVELLGVQLHTSAAAAGAELFDQVQNRRRRAATRGKGSDAAGRNRARVIDRAGPMPPLAGHTPGDYIETPLSFRPRGGLPADTLEAAEYAHGFDVRKQRLPAAKIKLGYCTDDDPEPTHIDDAVDGDGTVAALLSVEPTKWPFALVRVTLPAWHEPRLPAPASAQGEDGPVDAWITIPTLRLLLEDPETRHGAGYDLDELAPREMWAWPEQGDLLAGPWYDRLSKALYAAADDPPVEAHLKTVYTGYFGRMWSTISRDSQRPWHHQPVWYQAFIAAARAEQWRKVHRAAWDKGLWPALIAHDEVVYLSGDDLPSAETSKGRAEPADPASVAPAADNGRIGALRYKGRSVQLDDRVKTRIGQQGGHLDTVWATLASSTLDEAGAGPGPGPDAD